jgi:hypothetical protein
MTPAEATARLAARTIRPKCNECWDVGAIFVAGLARDCPGCKRPTIVEALKMWSVWSAQVPPTGTTGNVDADRELSDAFRALLRKSGLHERQAEIEHRAFRLNDFPAPNQPADLARAELLRWWLALYEDVWLDAYREPAK